MWSWDDLCARAGRARQDHASAAATSRCRPPVPAARGKDRGLQAVAAAVVAHSQVHRVLFEWLRKIKQKTSARPQRQSRSE